MYGDDVISENIRHHDVIRIEGIPDSLTIEKISTFMFRCFNYLFYYYLFCLFALIFS